MIVTDINSYGENDHIVETEFVGQLEHLFAISHFVHAARSGIQNRVPSLYDRPTTYSAPSGLKLILNGCASYCPRPPIRQACSRDVRRSTSQTL